MSEEGMCKMGVKPVCNRKIPHGHHSDEKLESLV